MGISEVWLTLSVFAIGLNLGLFIANAIYELKRRNK